MQELKPLVQYFSNGSFCSSAIFLVTKIQTLNLEISNSLWLIRITVAEKFLNLLDPFNFPDTFMLYKNRNDLTVKLKIIKTFFQEENFIRNEFLLIKDDGSSETVNKLTLGLFKRT